MYEKILLTFLVAKVFWDAARSPKYFRNIRQNKMPVLTEQRPDEIDIRLDVLNQNLLAFDKEVATGVENRLNKLTRYREFLKIAEKQFERIRKHINSEINKISEVSDVNPIISG